MPTDITSTGDISFRTAGYVSGEMLKRAQPLMIVSRLGQSKPLPRNSTKKIKFRGYAHLDNQPKPLLEGVTPEASRPEYRDVEADIQQYGDFVRLTDVLQDTHEDPLIQEFSGILGEQAAIMLERVTIGKILAGTNVFFSGSTGGVLATSRDGVNEPVSLALQRLVIRGLKRQLTQPITQVVAASANFNTSPIAPAYIAVTHTDLEADIREIPGFVPVEKYGSYKPLMGEIGAVEGVRYCTTTLLEPWTDAGAAPKAGYACESMGGACADVYPILYFGKDAFATIPFAVSTGGKAPITPMVLNPGTPRGSDPLGQRGSIAWKAYHSAVILYDFYMARAEVAVTRL